MRDQSSFTDILLSSLENDGNCLAYHASALERHVSMLVSMPAFRTIAEANLEQAEQQLTAALATVKKARRDMRPARRKPTVHLIAAE